MATKQPIVPCLWFDNQAEEAARYYTGIFKTPGSEELAGIPKPGVKCTGDPPAR